MCVSKLNKSAYNDMKVYRYFMYYRGYFINDTGKISTAIPISLPIFALKVTRYRYHFIKHCDTDTDTAIPILGSNKNFKFK